MYKTYINFDPMSISLHKETFFNEELSNLVDSANYQLQNIEKIINNITNLLNHIIEYVYCLLRDHPDINDIRVKKHIKITDLIYRVYIRAREIYDDIIYPCITEIDLYTLVLLELYSDIKSIPDRLSIVYNKLYNHIYRKNRSIYFTKFVLNLKYILSL